MNIKEIESAALRLNTVAKNTPLEFSKRLSEKYHAQIYFKREDLQEVRSFKIRGAYNKIASLNKSERTKGVVCASAGNHAQGVAFSCAKMKIKGIIFMPLSAPNQKIEKVKKFGGRYVEVILTGENFDEASKASKNYCEKNNMVYVHPFDDPYVIAGQGTVGKEILEQRQDIDLIVAPIGGGGLISGVSTFVKKVSPKTRIVGCESAGAASMHLSIKNDSISTLENIDNFVDGTAVKTPGNHTFKLIKDLVDKIIVVEEGQVCSTMIELYQFEGIVAEPAGAMSISALEQLKDQIKEKNVVCILSGGNNDILRYPEIMERSLVHQGKKHYIVINFAQKPGQLKKFLNEALGSKDDIVRFEYMKKSNKEKGPALVGLEVPSRKHFTKVLDKMNKLNFNYTVLKAGDIMYDYLV